MRAEDVVDILEADAEREQLAPPALLAGKVERRRMSLVLACAGVDQHGVPRRAHHESLVGHHHLAGRGVEDLRLHRRHIPLEGPPFQSREYVLRPPPLPVPLHHRLPNTLLSAIIVPLFFYFSFPLIFST